MDSSMDKVLTVIVPVYNMENISGSVWNLW